MEDDWDLHAVVRGCAALTAAAPSTTATATAAATSSQPPHTSTNQLDCSLSASCFQDLFEPRRTTFFPEELHDLYRPFFPKPLPPLSTPLFSLDPPSDPSPPPPPPPPPQIVKQLAQQTQFRQKQPAFSVSNGSKTNASQNPSPRSKRRKSLTKKICHVSAENLSSDVWSWRKYGQKPIKGSPYPRGYYKCSTSKGCMARKQVERNRSDPGMFIVTYTAEHNHPMPTHRNSLAGSTRQKPAEAPNKPSSSSSSSPELSPAPSLSPAPEKLESSPEAEDEDDEFSVSKMALDDDFFDGLEDFAATPDAGDFASGHLPGTLPFPWLPATATTTAGCG